MEACGSLKSQVSFLLCPSMYFRHGGRGWGGGWPTDRRDRDNKILIQSQNPVQSEVALPKVWVTFLALAKMYRAQG